MASHVWLGAYVTRLRCRMFQDGGGACCFCFCLPVTEAPLKPVGAACATAERAVSSECMK
ncbi:Hypothetical predicted protein [Podarcis lilfordi]|uniref:Uncharacterized protein n=1 Tax=Podarcis lilfordi TaxID=74358 RepID=A0AA35LCU8_9SAUR|nr:Hypothetical predicted protein [Podarcis lilfordi]